VFRDRVDRLKDMALLMAQSAIAAALAWTVARELIGHARPFFAPIAAVIAIGTTLGQRGRRTVELVAGVTIGVAVADLLIAGIGTGTWQLALAIVLAMGAAILVGGGGLLTTQAAVSAVLVATLQPPTGGVDFTRAVDALVGGVAAIVVTGVLPAHPLVRVRRAAARAIPELAATLDDIAAAIRVRDADRAEAALERARALDVLASAVRDEVQAGQEMLRLSPPRRVSRGQLVEFEGAAAQLDLAVRNVRVLARGVTRALDLHDPVPPSLADAVDDLAEAVRALGDVLERGEGEDRAREAAVRAAGRATLALEETGNLSVSVLVGAVRSAAVDLLRSAGLDKAGGQAAVREAADRMRAEAPG
jgi:uncharacterized membrane protein YgaE (UPF0421/DUF939 family)